MTVKANARHITVEGPRGKLGKYIRHMHVDITQPEEKKLQINIWHGARNDIAKINTLSSMIRNMILGVTRGFEYKMRFVYAHFPINVTVTDDTKGVEIRNFLGEKRVRKVAMKPGVTCSRSKDTKDELILEGNDIDMVSQSAALVHQSCLVKRKDIRKFLDGIYVSAKGNVVKDF